MSGLGFETDENIATNEPILIQLANSIYAGENIKLNFKSAFNESQMFLNMCNQLRTTTLVRRHAMSD